MGVKPTKVELSYVISTPELIKEVLAKDIKLDSLIEFTEGFISTRLKTLKSEAEPVAQEQVIKLVGTSLNQYISSSLTETVLLMHNQT